MNGFGVGVGTTGQDTAAGLPPVRRFPAVTGTEARFGLLLAGVDATPAPDDPGRTAGAFYRGCLPAWPPVLAPGEGLDLIYRMSPGRLQVLLRGRALGADPEESIERVQGLWHNLQLVLEGARRRYAFSPVGDDALLEDWWLTCRVQLDPVGFRVETGGGGGIGFVAPLASGGPDLLLDAGAGQPPLPCDSLVQAAAVCRSRIEVCIALERMGLERASMAAVGAALGQLRGGGRVCYGGPGRRPVEERGTIKALEQLLVRWQRNPSGLRQTVTVSTDRPPPATLLALLGAELFGGRDLTWRDRSDRTPGTTGPERPAAPVAPCLMDTEGAIDLRTDVPQGTSVWPALPSLKALRDLGVPPLFADRVDSLPEGGILLGQVGQRERSRVVRFAPLDRGRHCYLLGATGTGKSTLLLNMVRQDLWAGAGLCLLDPHGDLTEQVLDAVPAERLDDVILFDPSDPDRAVGLNFLETDGANHGRQVNFITNEMIRIFGRLYDLRQTGGPIFEQYMRNALLLLMDAPGAGTTLVELPLLFEDKEFRRRLLKRCQAVHVVSFWTDQAERTSGETALSNMGPYITSKLNQFTHNAVLRPIIGQSRSTINFRECMDRGKILLVNLSKGRLGAMDTQLLGMLIIGKLLDAALGRAGLPPETRRPFHLYVDEAQNFLTDTVTELLSEARKFGLHLTLANQTLAQMGGEGGLIGSLLGNVGTLLLFRLGILDAERLAGFMLPDLGARQLQELPNFHVASRLLVDGRPSRSFVFRTEGLAEHPLAPRERKVRRGQIQARGAAYTRDLAAVEREIQERPERLADRPQDERFTPETLFDPRLLFEE